MKKILKSLLLAAGVITMAASCTNAAKMAEAADKIKIKCNPDVLEAVAGKIDADVDVTFPEEYFLPKATLEITPVIIYIGGEVAGKPFMYQGEKIADNFKSVSKDGATISEKIHFDFVPGMEKSELVARAKVMYKGNEYTYPADIKIADGVNNTYTLVDRSGTKFLPMIADNYQEIIPQKEEAQILYMINSSEVRNSEITSTGIKNFVNALKALENDARRTVKGTEIVAYASPDGAYNLNDKLSAAREQSAKKAFDSVTKTVDAGNVSTRSIAEDWEGFQELVQASNIEDKELILRVLSMYSDPNVREREIRNMSSVYTSLASEVLPELRRARFITNVEYANFTADELTELLSNNISALDEEALLRTATLVKDSNAKLAAYKKAITSFDSDRARYNAAVVCLKDNKDTEAKNFVSSLKDKTTDIYKNILGVIEMRAGNYDKAEKLFNEAGDISKANKGVIDILNGKYAEAAHELKGLEDHNAVLANILNGNLTEAAKSIKGDCPRASYYKAIIAARQGNVTAAKEELEKACKNEALAERAKTDIEFAKVK